jgi:hypothetical protein
MSTLFVFLVVAGGTAIAAKGLAKNSVGSKQLKSNAVTTAKIKKGAVTKAKLGKNAVSAAALADGSVTGAKLADGSVTGADFAPSGTPFSQIVARIQNPNDVAFTPGTAFTIGTYTQQPDEDNQYLAAIDVTFSPSCLAPREAVAMLAINAADPANPTIYEVSGGATVYDQTTGTTTNHVNFGPAIGSYGGLNKAPPLAPAGRTFSVFLEEVKCGEGSGATVTDSVVEVIGTK